MHVEHVLEGSVRKSGRKLRIAVQLIKVADGSQVWSEKFDREMSDVFAIQDEISTAIVRSLKVQFIGDTEQPRARRYTGNAAAYQLYLKGRYYYFKWTSEGFARSMEFYREAIKVEPRYALAFAGIADSCWSLWCFGNLSGEAGALQAREAALKAIEIDDGLAEAHSALARFKCFYTWDREGAEKEFKRAIELDRNYVTAREQYAFYLASLGRFEEAIKQARRAQELDPLSLVTNLTLGWVFWFAGRIDQCERSVPENVRIRAEFLWHLLVARSHSVRDGKLSRRHPIF
ncbi:MAG: hypothetical protein FJ403_16430 [Verrucomicrobia bacterium]|nr:hypothetical protein [Verrucomicrobiota bacterium]